MGVGLGGRLQRTRVVVFYFSKGGNTKKVAEAIAQELEVEALDVAAVGSGYNLKKCDLVFIGSGNYSDSPGPEVLKFLEGCIPAKDRYGAVFGTQGGSSQEHLNKMQEVLEKKGVRMLGKWSCPGQEYELKNKGRPNENDLREARDFAEKTLRKIEVL